MGKAQFFSILLPETIVKIRNLEYDIGKLFHVVRLRLRGVPARDARPCRRRVLWEGVLAVKRKPIRWMSVMAAAFVLAGALMWPAPRPKLLENDARDQFAAEDTLFLPEEPTPLTGLPEASEESQSPAELDEVQAAYVEEVLTLVNQEREKAGLPPLELDSALQQAAQTRAVECSKKFSHTRPDGTSYKTAIAEAGLEVVYTGENVASGHTSPEHVMQGWMHSSGHKANILNAKYTKIGIGLVENTGSYYGGYAWAQLFVQ